MEATKGNMNKRLRAKFIYICVFAVGVFVKGLADYMAYVDKFSSAGALLTLLSSVTFFFCSFLSVPLSFVISIITITNGMLYFRIVKRFLVHNDVFGTDPWLVIGAWIWILVGTLSLATAFVRFVRSRSRISTRKKKSLPSA